jgi:phospholipid/cholesterol/gamma-HCH transport system permease protein
MENELPSVGDMEKEVESGPAVRRMTFDTQGVTNWDSGLLTFLIKVNDLCSRGQIDMVTEGLPEGARRLLALASAIPERKGARREAVRESLLTRIGQSAIESTRSAGETLAFFGEASLAFMKFLMGRASFRRSDLMLLIQECGAQAFGIVTLISVLVGLILAFVGAVQLKIFGAEIYVADLVGIGMAREMGAMMTAIIMAGRTGAAFAAQLGTMQVNEEIDALSTLGISPMEFLVLPRMLALVLMMPLLCIYADIMGILGGAVVGIGMLDIETVQYFQQTRHALNLNHFAVGIVKSAVFGIIVALSGCLMGIKSGRSASAVGNAATSAVVSAIVWIVVFDGAFAVIASVLGI